MDAETRQLAEQLKDIHEKMTPGPWQVQCRNKSTQVENFQVVGRDDSAAVGYMAQDGTEIAQLRNLLPNIIAALASQWIKITDDPETLPEVGVTVYLWSCHGWPTVGRLQKYSNGQWWWNNHANFPSECFTHWMLPSPPRSS